MRNTLISSLMLVMSTAHAAEAPIRTLAISVASPNVAPQAAPTTPTVLFLNRAQATMKAGNDDSSQDISSVVEQQGLSSATIPAFAGSDATWQQVVTCMRGMYKQWNVIVTDQRPTQPGYVQAHFGGNGSELNLPSGTGGVAPIDSQRCNTIPSAVVYVFSDVYKSNAEGMCEAGAQEIGHAFSLDHEYLCQDPMTYLQGCGAKTFQDTDAECGESKSRACICGRMSQNSVQILTERLGPAVADATAPIVSITSPADGAMLDGNAWTIVASASDNIAVTKIELHIDDGGARVSVCGDNTLPCTTAAGTSTWQLPAGTGTRTFSVWAYDAANNVGKSATRAVTLGKPPGGVDAGAGGVDGGVAGGTGTGGNGSNGNGGSSGGGSRGDNVGGCAFASTSPPAGTLVLVIAMCGVLARSRRQRR